MDDGVSETPVGIDNLVPREVPIEGRLTPNDGLLLKNLWRERAQLPRQNRLRNEIRACEQLLRNEQFGPAEAKLASMCRDYPESVWPWFVRGQLAAHHHDVDTALELFQRALALTPQADELQAQILDLMICVVLFEERIDLLPAAERWSDEAVRTHPDRVTLTGSRGAVLIEQGEISAGTAMLRHVLATSTATKDLAISEAYLALAAARLGKHEEARERLQRAHTFHSGLPVLHRLGARIEKLRTTQAAADAVPPAAPA